MQIYVQCNKKTMIKLIKKMENCSESSFILFVKTPQWSRHCGQSARATGCVWVVRPPARRLVSNSNGDKPTKRIFIRFCKNVEPPPEMLRDHLVINKQVDSISGLISFVITPDDFWVRNESSILGAIFHLIK